MEQPIQKHRFFVTADCLIQNKAIIKGEQSHQICRVLRLQPGAHIIILDNSGWEYDVEIEKLGGEQVRGKVISKTPCPNEPDIKLTLYQALLKIDKFEFVLQKSVELGVSAIIPFISERCAAGEPATGKIERWQKIIREAAEQSKRALLPALHPAASFREACDSAEGPSVLFWEDEKSTGLSQILRRSPFREVKAINTFIGPEGGFTSSEAEYAGVKGIAIAGLGKRILRAETAGIAAISAIFYEKGEFG